VIAQLLERLSAHLMSDPELLVEGNGAVGVLEGAGVVAGLEGHLRRQGVELVVRQDVRPADDRRAVRGQTRLMLEKMREIERRSVSRAPAPGG